MIRISAKLVDEATRILKTMPIKTYLNRLEDLAVARLVHETGIAETDARDLIKAVGFDWKALNQKAKAIVRYQIAAENFFVTLS